MRLARCRTVPIFPWLAAAAWIGAADLRAQSAIVGKLRTKAQTTITLPTSELTLVDLANPVVAPAQITSVTVEWAGGGVTPCPGA